MLEEKSEKRKIILYLGLPVAILFALTIILLALMHHHLEGFVVYLLYTIFAFLIAIAIETYLFQKKIIPLFSENKRIQSLLDSQEQSGRLLIRRDLELTKAYDKLHELDERKSEFVSIVAHQLRTPLSGVKWTLDMLIHGEFGELNSEQKSFLIKGYESNQRLIALIDDMLNVDRIESGKYQYVFQDIQILDLFDSILFEMNPEILKKHLHVEFESKDRTLPKVSVDPDKIRAVIQNLLDNAIKYTPFGGRVSIRTIPEGDFVRICIKDNGIGIPRDQQKNVFNRFFRARNAIKVQTDGSGLGLFIVRSIIEKHGGRVWFESVEGTGTDFCFTVKMAQLS